VLPAEREAARQKIQIAARNQSELEIECRILAADGTTRWLWISGGYRADAQGRAHMVGIVQDISERKLAEEELVRFRTHLQELVDERTVELDEARRAAEIASVAKSQFLANMSHEIRTPLGAIAGMSRLVRRDPLSPRQTDHLNKLDAAAGHLSATISDILDLSKIEAGKLDLVNEPVQLDALVSNVMDLLELRASEKNLVLKSTIGTLPPHLYGDATRLRQALLNYAGNALKFTDAGSITLRLEALEETDADVLIRWEVADTGIGIDQSQFTQLFQAFEQADSSTARKYGGTGLGLAITRRLALAMGGEAGASGALGQGSTFWFTSRLRKGLPGEPKARDESEPHAADILRTTYRNTRVLLVDDDAFNREIGKIILEDVGIAVDLAEDGRIACGMAQQTAYDVILMDMQMPHLDGMDATRAIRKLPSGRTVPIIAITANAFSEDRARCLESGMNDFITKPFEPQLLYAALVRWLKAA
jgi:signal transduction histidine kinase/ActR/RegA family two-component response regulator